MGIRMKKAIALVLTVVMCFVLCACGKSEVAEKADEMILAIGELSAEKENAISAAKAFFDTLSEDQKDEVENRELLLDMVEKLPDVLAAAKADEMILAIGELSPEKEDAVLAAEAYFETLSEEQKKEVKNKELLTDAVEKLPALLLAAKEAQVSDLIEQEEYVQASILLMELPEMDDWENLMCQCGYGCLSSYIKKNGAEKDAGMFFLNLYNQNNTQISVWFNQNENTLQLIRFSSESKVQDGMEANYSIGDDSMYFTRSTINSGAPVNYQEGYISIDAYTGGFSGSVVDNSSEQLVIHGLTVTEAQSAYEKQTRGYQTATMVNINEMLDALFEILAEDGYAGTWANLGFESYQSK